MKVFNRRKILKSGVYLGLASAAFPSIGNVVRASTLRRITDSQSTPMQATKPDHVIEIDTSVVEIAKDVAISTKTYNGGFPGPLLRLTEGRQVVIDILNNTDTPEQLHWHGQFLDVDVDGAAEEGTPFIPAHSKRRISFIPNPAGFRFYHTHMMAGEDLSLGLYNGQAGPVYIEPTKEAGAYDREVFLTLKEFGLYFNHSEMTTGFLEPTHKVRELFDLDQRAIAMMRSKGREPGWQVGYRYATINGKMMGAGAPIHVKTGERVLLHVLNASATEIHSLALPGHVFEVLSLDGNPVPNPNTVPVLWLGPAERISAVVEMNAPGVWVLGETDRHARMKGMGIVVEYADQRGEPAWVDQRRSSWDYRLFGHATASSSQPDETIELTFTTQYSERNGFDVFAINGIEFSMDSMRPLKRLYLGRRYRLKMRNATDDIHPIHFHRHTFELTKIGGKSTSGVLKDVAMIGGFQEMEIDFTADRTGLSLFHCHMQNHMDAGFMALFDCA